MQDIHLDAIDRRHDSGVELVLPAAGEHFALFEKQEPIRSQEQDRSRQTGGGHHKAVVIADDPADDMRANQSHETDDAQERADISVP